MSRDNEFEDGNHFYRFLEHEPFIPRCFNFRGSPNDSEPKPASIVSHRLTKIMSAVLESFASEDRRHLDYVGISNSEEFRRYFSHALSFLHHLKFHLKNSSTSFIILTKCIMFLSSTTVIFTNFYLWTL